MANRQFILCIQVSEREYVGHTVEVNGDEVAFRKYDGSTTPEVEEEIGSAFGAMLLKELQEQHPGRWHADDDEATDPWNSDEYWNGSW